MKKLEQIINQLRNGISVEQMVNQRKNECIEESQKVLKGNPAQIDRNGRKRTIGLNKVGIARFSGMISASSDFINEERRVRIESGIGDIVEVRSGNLDEIYSQLFDILKTIDRDSIGIEAISLIVRQLVNEYFGEKGNGEKRLEELLTTDEGISDLSALKGKNLAACVERAMLSQNLLKLAGLDATIKQSTIMRNGNREGHAYNIIRSAGVNYIYDTSLPRIYENGDKSPIVGTISDEEYMLIVDGLAAHGCQTKPMSNGIIYDSSFGILGQELTRYTPEDLRALKRNAGVPIENTQNQNEVPRDDTDVR